MLPVKEKLEEDAKKFVELARYTLLPHLNNQEEKPVLLQTADSIFQLRRPTRNISVTPSVTILKKPLQPL